jgi:hypothetical protein
LFKRLLKRRRNASNADVRIVFKMFPMGCCQFAVQWLASFYELFLKRVRQDSITVNLSFSSSFCMTESAKVPMEC